MSKDQAIGWSILTVSTICIVIYFYLTFLSQWILLTIQLSASLAVSAILLIVAWIGYTMATTPPPIPIENMDLEEAPTSESTGEAQTIERK